MLAGTTMQLPIVIESVLQWRTEEQPTADDGGVGRRRSASKSMGNRSWVARTASHHPATPLNDC